MIPKQINKKINKIEEKTIRDISSRIQELITKVEKKTWNDATLYAFQVGLSSDVEEGINKAFQEGAKEEKEKVLKIIDKWSEQYWTYFNDDYGYVKSKFDELKQEIEK